MSAPTDTTPIDRRRSREELRGQALALRKAGATYAKIASALGVSFKTAYRISKQAERLADQRAPQK